MSAQSNKVLTYLGTVSLANGGEIYFEINNDNHSITVLLMQRIERAAPHIEVKMAHHAGHSTLRFCPPNNDFSKTENYKLLGNHVIGRIFIDCNETFHVHCTLNQGGCRDRWELALKEIGFKTLTKIGNIPCLELDKIQVAPCSIDNNDKFEKIIQQMRDNVGFDVQQKFWTFSTCDDKCCACIYADNEGLNVFVEKRVGGSHGQFVIVHDRIVNLFSTPTVVDLVDKPVQDSAHDDKEAMFGNILLNCISQGNIQYFDFLTAHVPIDLTPNFLKNLAKKTLTSASTINSDRIGLLIDDASNDSLIRFLRKV